MKRLLTLFATLSVALASYSQNQLYTAPPKDAHTRWVTPENPTGAKGKGGMTNKGAKGTAFIIVPAGESAVLCDISGAGIINRIWTSGSIAENREQRRAVSIEMYWDNGATPAVSAPIGDFFGVAHAHMARYDNALFQDPEGRSFNCTIPMPFAKRALITITNSSSAEVWFWYDIDYTALKRMPRKAMYFHTFWSRNTQTTLGEDFVILPRVEGRGRYLGANIGFIRDERYDGWFGEGEAKFYLDGDEEYPTLCGTGTEDYIGSGWGQGSYAGRYFGSPVKSSDSSVYAFYRFHIDDPIFFHRDCKATIQLIGNAGRQQIRQMIEKGTPITLTWFADSSSGRTRHRHLLDETQSYTIGNDESGGASYFISADVCATAYFYLDSPENGLPALPSAKERLAKLSDKVWNKEFETEVR